MDKRLTFLGGLGLGAGLMFLLDPGAGRRRRKTGRDRALAYFRDARQDLGRAGRDLDNRARGLAARTRARLRPDMVDDTVLVERVRATLGRAAAHPHAIDVVASEGRVTLRGPILAADVDGVLRAAGSVRGVQEVENQLEVHHSPEGVPSLQGAPREGLPS